MTTAYLSLKTSQTAAFLLCMMVTLGQQAIAGDQLHQHPERETESADELVPLTSLKRMRNAFNAEAHDVANALRSLDQSYAFRGFRGCGSCTAGSVFVDWESKGLQRPEGVRILPPAPVNLSGRKLTDDCETCGERIAKLKDCRDHHRQRGVPQLTRPSCQACDSQVSASGLFSVEFSICMKPQPCDVYTPILSLGDDWTTANFSLGKVGDELRFRFLTNAEDEFGSLQHEINLGTLSPGFQRIGLCYSPGELLITIDGERFGTLTNITGDLQTWRPHEELQVHPGWDTRVKDVAINVPQ